MNLAELKGIADSVVTTIETQGSVKMAGTENGAEYIPVVVYLAEPGIGASPVSEIKSAGLGFDWNAGKFILYSEDELVRKNFEKKQATKIRKMYGSTEIYYCGSCGIIINRSDRFCKECGKEFV